MVIPFSHVIVQMDNWNRLMNMAIGIIMVVIPLDIHQILYGIMVILVRWVQTLPLIRLQGQDL